MSNPKNSKLISLLDSLTAHSPSKDQSLMDYADRIADIFEESLFSEVSKRKVTDETPSDKSEHIPQSDIPTQVYTSDLNIFDIFDNDDCVDDQPKQNDALYDVIGLEDAQTPKVIFNEGATILLWEDGTKIVVKAHGEPIDHEKGYAMAIAKYIFLDNHGHWYNEFHREIEKAEANEARRIALRAMKDIRPVYKKTYDKWMTKLTQERMTEDGLIINGDGTQDDPKDILNEESLREWSEKAHKKAYEAAIRQYRNGKHDGIISGLDISVINEAVENAIKSYYEQMLRQH